MGGMEPAQAAHPEAACRAAGALRHHLRRRVHPPAKRHGKGYKRVRFEEAWEAYLPGQNTSSAQNGFPKRASVQMPMERAQPSDFRSVQEDKSARIEKHQLSLQPCGFARLHGSKARKWCEDEFDHA